MVAFLQKQPRTRAIFLYTRTYTGSRDQNQWLHET